MPSWRHKDVMSWQFTRPLWLFMTSKFLKFQMGSTFIFWLNNKSIFINYLWISQQTCELDSLKALQILSFIFFISHLSTSNVFYIRFKLFDQLTVACACVVPTKTLSIKSGRLVCHYVNTDSSFTDIELRSQSECWFTVTWKVWAGREC